MAIKSLCLCVNEGVGDAAADAMKRIRGVIDINYIYGYGIRIQCSIAECSTHTHTHTSLINLQL